MIFYFANYLLSVHLQVNEMLEIGQYMAYNNVFLANKFYKISGYLITCLYSYLIARYALTKNTKQKHYQHHTCSSLITECLIVGYYIMLYE